MGQFGGLINFESGINISDPVFMRFPTVFTNFQSVANLIFTVNNYLQHELAGITRDPVLKNLLMDSSQIIKILRTNRIHVVHEELHGVPSGEYLRCRP